MTRSLLDRVEYVLQTSPGRSFPAMLHLRTGPLHASQAASVRRSRKLPSRPCQPLPAEAVPEEPSEGMAAPASPPSMTQAQVAATKDMFVAAINGGDDMDVPQSISDLIKVCLSAQLCPCSLIMPIAIVMSGCEHKS